MKERDISKYLNARVRELGGEIRRVRWIGRNNAPDKLILIDGAHGWVEEKRPGKVAEAAQHREHKRMATSGMRVRVVASKEDVDRFLDRLLWVASIERAKRKQMLGGP